MGVQSYDNVSFSLTNTNIQSWWDYFLRIVEHPQIGTLRQIRGNDFPSAVGDHAVHKEDFQIVFGIVLGHDAFNAMGNVFLLVINWANY